MERRRPGRRDVGPPPPRAGLAIFAKRLLERLEQIGFRTEVAEMLVAALGFVSHLAAHLGAVVAMECVALDIGRGHVLAAKDLLERALHRCGARAGRAGYRDDGMPTGHARPLRETVRAAQTAARRCSRTGAEFPDAGDPARAPRGPIP